MITDQTTLAELEALRDKLGITSLLVTRLRDTSDRAKATVEVLALTPRGTARFTSEKLHEALNGAFELCAPPASTWRSVRAASNENTEQRAKRIGHDVRTISASGTVRCQCERTFDDDETYAEHVWTVQP